MEDYNFKVIEKKWQEIWEKENYGKSDDSSSKPKHYHLVEFPYPSGAGLHVGHCMGYGASDAYCRMKRLQGFNTMYPIGWDAFGLPTENYAIKNKIKPQKATEDNISNFKKQMRSLAYSFDWSREVNTTDPNYYRWTQWIFLQFYKHAVVDNKLIEVADDDTTTPRLAFQAEMPVNWCPSCRIILANEEVIGGNCERCGAQTEKRKQKQWMLRITAYADRLIKDLDSVDYLDKIKTQQINWIGKSVGAEVEFEIQGQGSSSEGQGVIKVFTTRPDTLFGATFMAVAPEHEIISKLQSKISNWNEVEEYINQAKKKSDMERTELAKEKTGVELKGIKAINPVNDEEIPIFAADYVLSTYGTGAVMSVPAHDERDWEFAKKYGLEIKNVVSPVYGEEQQGEELRKTISAVIQRESDGKFLYLHWPEQNWIVPVIGGIEEGETPIETVKREVLEETGYRVKEAVQIGPEIESHFFANHKNVKRKRLNLSYSVKIEEGSQSEPKRGEFENFEIVWLTKDEALKQITFEDSRISLQWYLSHNSCFSDYGRAINSDFIDGLMTDEAKEKMVEWLEENRRGKKAINFKLRDWIFSRQHYWGEPIPIIYCRKCWEELRIKNKELSEKGTFAIINEQEHAIVPIPEDQLPVALPEVENYEPTDSGESPLAKITEWVETTCPKCGGKATRETDTMPNWAGSSWYFLAYAMKHGSWNMEHATTENIFSAKAKELKYWMPVDLYNGGMEHTTLHLLYSRFWHKFLYDLGVVPTAEPYAKRIAHGIILGPDGRKMSKSFGNVINPDDIAKEFGADTLRAYIMFIGPYDQESAWSTAGVQGVHRFLKRVWLSQGLLSDNSDKKELLVKLNQTIAGVSDDLENFRMNTVISKLMELNNTIEKAGVISNSSYSIFLRLLFSACPHIASEIWEKTGQTGKIEDSIWPTADPKYLVADELEIPVQINGKVRARITVPSQISEEDLKAAVMNDTKVAGYLHGAQILKVIVVPKKLVSIVIKQPA